MKVSSAITGTTLKEFRTKITQRQINNYAAAVSDPNPYYLDDRRDGGLIAPPTMASAVTWPIFQNISDYVELGYPPEILFKLVHYSEHLVIHRPLLPGDTLTIAGEIAAVIPEKNGTHVIFKLPALDTKGNPVFTEYIGGMLRGVECCDAGKGVENLPKTPASAGSNTPVWEIALPIKREACYIYEGCTDVIFPIHTSPAFAQSVGLPDIIYFGIATLAQALRELVNRENSADPSRVSAISCFFRGMVLPDSFIRIQLLERAESNNSKTFFFRVLNQDGKEAVSRGVLQISSRAF